MTLNSDQPSRPLPAPTARVVRAEVTEAPISVTELADAVQDAAAGRWGRRTAGCWPRI